MYWLMQTGNQYILELNGKFCIGVPPCADSHHLLDCRNIMYRQPPPCMEGRCALSGVAPPLCVDGWPLEGAS